VDLNLAAAKHAEWKIRFFKAIAGKMNFDQPSVAADDCCELGVWLHGAAGAKYGHLPSYTCCVSEHAAFHVEAGKIAAAINARRYDDASDMMSPGKHYAKASLAVKSAILALKAETGL
jgi:methyl-accepting chemotaxis protein